LYVQLHIYATNSIENSVHANIVVKIKTKIFVNLPGMDSTHTKCGALQHTRLPQRKFIKHTNEMPSFA